jgi:ATP-dependent exoDNAse (exonuclease V) beta subunit
MFLEAGAGSGKTACLVDRFLALVNKGVPADAIAAITFTERAASELADRIRTALQRGAATNERYKHALDVLDQAAISTLHAFAQRLLTEHPIEAGLPPRVEVLDEITSEVAFQRRWEVFVDRLLDDPDLEQPLRLLLACDAKLGQLRDVAMSFGDNWDLVVERRGTGPRAVEVTVDIDGLCGDLDAVAREAAKCRNDDDKLFVRLGELAEYASALRDATDDEARLQVLRRDKPSFKAGIGQAPNWPDVKALRARVVDLGERRDELVTEITGEILARLADELAGFTVEAADERRREGRLEFHDLLVLARQVLRDPDRGPEVRAALRNRYQRLLLDEFQDTDPIQVELAVLIASADPNAGGKPWHEIEVEPGRLFFVGDPKQSIYRFRRADIGVFLTAEESLVDEPEHLTTNFRTVEPVVDWVNRTFETMIVEDPGSQPAYLRLDPHREAPRSGPPVVFLGADAHGDKPYADDLREREAADVAAVIRRAVAEAWDVFDTDTKQWRPASWRDVAVLLPARTSLQALERAFEEADVPYRAETSSLVYGTREVRDLLAVVRAVDDPTDMLSLVAALRSPSFGCGDDDLYTWKITHGGRWDHQAPVPHGCPPDHPVARAVTWLAELHGNSAWLSPSEVVDTVVRERRLLEVAFVHPRPRDLWRRLRFVVDQARAWEEATGGSLRDYLTWVQLQSAESARVVETILPETDDESVRIMTVHGAKGLEFPITVLSGMTTALKGRRGGVEVRFPDGVDGWAIKLGKGISTAEFDAYKPRDEQMDHDERIRLLYVAATRARDHLVVSTHRKTAAPDADPSTAAELFWAHGNHDDLVTVFEPAANEAEADTAEEAPLEPLLPRTEWQAELDEAFAAGRRRIAISATSVAEELARLAAEADPGLAKDPRDLDLPPWQKGRYGTAIGRAVHAVLQTVDLATGEGLAEAAAAQAAAEGVLGREDVIEALARSALDSPVVQEAARRPHWREVYVGIPLGDSVLEGYIDLLYRGNDGLVVIDHKTDSWRTETALDAKVDRYSAQLAAYALAANRVTGERITQAILLFLGAGSAVARAIPDLPSAMTTVGAIGVGA